MVDDEKYCCNVCCEHKLKSYFGKDKKRKNGIKATCKDCEKRKRREKLEAKGVKKIIYFNELGQKRCSKCQLYLDTVLFSQMKNGTYASWCKPCHKTHRESKEVRERNKAYWELNKEELKCRQKEWRIKNKEKISENKKAYYILNKEVISKKKRERYKQNYKQRPQFRLKENFRNNILKMMKGKYKKSKATDKILGCIFEDFKNHIEKQFENWMTWDNYGLYNGEESYGWDLDHIIPVSLSETEEDIYLLNHWSNFQPLCSKVNRDVKNNKLYPVTNLELNLTYE